MSWSGWTGPQPSTHSRGMTGRPTGPGSTEQQGRQGTREASNPAASIASSSASPTWRAASAGSMAGGGAPPRLHLKANGPRQADLSVQSFANASSCLPASHESAWCPCMGHQADSWDPRLERRRGRRNQSDAAEQPLSRRAFRCCLSFRLARKPAKAPRTGRGPGAVAAGAELAPNEMANAG